jgi:S-adenosylmethionine:tRNA ribosyltransferase-isomerase
MELFSDISLYDYDLPVSLIAQTPAIPRESARLMIVSRADGAIRYKNVTDLPDFFRPGDVIIINNSKVFKARLLGKITRNGIDHRVELFLIRPIQNYWLALGKPGKKFIPGSKVSISDGFAAEVKVYYPDGTMEIDFNMPSNQVISLANVYGHVPVPPYIKNEPEMSAYQTSFAKIEGSVAAPTAGFHLTPVIRKKLITKGVEILEITLHVGLGTFLPVKTANIENHRMHAEWVNVSDTVAAKVNRAKHNHRRIVAIGTTSVRTLEGVAQINHGEMTGFSGDIDIFIKPGFKFQIIDGMLTNFHLPKSTLIILVSAFAGRENILLAYQKAIINHFRFYSFGDAMLVI